MFIHEIEHNKSFPFQNYFDKLHLLIDWDKKCRLLVYLIASPPPTQKNEY